MLKGYKPCFVKSYWYCVGVEVPPAKENKNDFDFIVCWTNAHIKQCGVTPPRNSSLKKYFRKNSFKLLWKSLWSASGCSIVDCTHARTHTIHILSWLLEVCSRRRLLFDGFCYGWTETLQCLLNSTGRCSRPRGLSVFFIQSLFTFSSRAFSVDYSRRTTTRESFIAFCFIYHF